VVTALCAATDPLPDVDEAVFDNMRALLRKMLEEIYTHFNGVDLPMPFSEMTGAANALLRYIRAGRKAEIAEMGEHFP
jgi:hypothetical protein